MSNPVSLTYKTRHPTSAEHTFFSSARGTCSRTDHVLNHNTNLRHLKGLNETKYGSILNADRV